MKRNRFLVGSAQVASIVLAMALGALVWGLGALAGGYKLGTISLTALVWATVVCAVGMELTFIYVIVARGGSEASAMVIITLFLLAFGLCGWMSAYMFSGLRNAPFVDPGMPFLLGLEFVVCVVGLPRALAMFELVLQPMPELPESTAPSRPIPVTVRHTHRHGLCEKAATVVVAAIALRYLTRRRPAA